MPNENKKPEGKTKPDQPKQQQRDSEQEKRFHARLALDPSITGAIAIAPFSTTLVEPIALAECLVEQSRMVNDGNLQRAEAMLITQAHTLDSIFSSLARRSAANMGENVQTAERYMRLALKAQSQCRATLQTLSELKNPIPVAYVHQANITSGPQQVNNGQRALGSSHAPARKNKINQTNYWKPNPMSNWTPERRARQAELIKRWKPWERSTGPRTAEGKEISARNAYKGGHRALLRELAELLKQCEQSIVVKQ